MEKLKAKHDHKLTDILKVFIFALFLLMPIIIMLPSMMYYGVNEYATAPTEEVEVYEYKQVDFNQYVNSNISKEVELNTQGTFQIIPQFTFDTSHIYLLKWYQNETLTSSLRNTPMLPSFNQYYDTNSNSNLNQNWYYWRFYPLQNGISNIYYWYHTLDALENPTYSNFTFYDLTKMFGVGNEPTIEQFSTYFPESYYAYTESEIMTLEIDTGTTENYTDITSQIQYNWTSLWKQPLFTWTNHSILKKGLDNFTKVFGITNTSNITNLITYELIIVAIYIVIDIVIQIFKWLTHLIGEK